MKKCSCIRRVLFILVQCTWGLPQTLIGLGFFIANRKRPHSAYRCSLDTQWKACGGLSLGLFIFTPPEEQQNAQLIRVHEYGHCIQSLLLGPLMLFVGIVSVAWGNLPYFRRLRQRKQLPYTVCFTESWASAWGEAVSGEKAIWQ